MKGERSAPKGRAGPAFLSVYPFWMRGFFSAGFPHRVGAGNGPASLLERRRRTHAAWMAACLCTFRFKEDKEIIQ